MSSRNFCRCLSFSVSAGVIFTVLCVSVTPDAGAGPGGWDTLGNAGPWEPIGELEGALRLPADPGRG